MERFSFIDPWLAPKGAMVISNSLNYSIDPVDPKRANIPMPMCGLP